jgi:hypothetical protein
MKHLERAADAFGEAATRQFAAAREGRASANGDWAGKK